jgi:hypothetical protein
MYLRAFVDPASKQHELWRYSPGFKPQAKAPKGVAWEDYFYDAAGELRPEDNDIEDFFAEVETIAAPHLQKLRDGNINLNDQEKGELATFIALLLTRTRSYRELVNTTASKMHVLGAKETLETPGGVEELIETNVRLGGERLEVEQVRQALQAVLDSNVIVEQKSKAWTIKQIFERSQDYDGVGSDDVDGPSPAWPQPGEQHPEQPIRPTETWSPGRLALEDGELMSEGENLRLQFEARPKRSVQGGEQRDEQGGHRPRTVSAHGPDLQREEDVRDFW